MILFLGYVPSFTFWHIYGAEAEASLLCNVQTAQAWVRRNLLEEEEIVLFLTAADFALLGGASTEPYFLQCCYQYKLNTPSRKPNSVKRAQKVPRAESGGGSKQDMKL